MKRLCVIAVFLLSLAACINAAPAQVTLTVAEPAGLARTNEIVTSGVPFPIGAVPTNSVFHLFDAAKREVPVQARVTGTWRDGSAKWALLDFPATLASNEVQAFTLKWNAEQGMAKPERALRIAEENDSFSIDSGALRLRVSRTNAPLIDFDLNGDGALAASEQGVGRLNWIPIVTPGAALFSLPPDEIVLEEPGPLHAVVRIAGWYCDANGKPDGPFMRYLVRVHAFAGSPRLTAQFTAINLGKTNQMVLVRSYGFGVALSAATDAAGSGGGSVDVQGWLGGDRVHAIKLGGRHSHGELTQTSESSYVCTLPEGDGTETKGIRSSGWAAWQSGGIRALVAVRDAWQQFPNTLMVDNNGVEAKLFESMQTPFEWDQGLAKTHELTIKFARAADSPLEDGRADFSREAALGHPEADLFAIAPAQWYCDSKVFGDVAPFNFDLFPDYETLTEASGDKFIKSMATGIRNWGDVYYGGPYKGKNSYMNLEYDVPHNFLVQFARTGERKYFDAARRMSQHQADIDVNHFTKWQWKHSPRHTEIQAEFGHTFTRGLLENSFFTGNRRTFEAAVELGDYFSKQIRNPRETGNERQIGWGLISLLPVYEATWDRKYLDAATATVDRLVSGQDAKGKFNIRWDNRIAFMNGIAATGFIYYERATGDARAAEAALRTIRRTKGFYPEYAGRTLEALAWAYQRTSDPEYLDLLKLTYETTMAKQIAWNTMELGAPTIFTVHTLPFLEKAGLVKKPVKPLNLTPAQFASENGLYAHHIPAGAGELFFQVKSTEPVMIAVVRKGAWKAEGTAELLDPYGVTVQKLSFKRDPLIWQRELIELRPRVTGTYHLVLRSATIENVRSGSYVTWDVATSRPMPAVVQTPDYTGLQFVTPALFTVPKGDAEKIELELVGEGEGFKRAVLYDPGGAVAGTVEAFVDLGNTGRYTYKLSAPIAAKHAEGLWRLSLQDVSIAKMSGLAPYFATSREAFFRP